MTFSVLTIKCRGECKKSFTSYLRGVMLAGVQYSCTCPACGKKEKVLGSATWLEQTVPDDAVKLVKI